MRVKLPFSAPICGLDSLEFNGDEASPPEVGVYDVDPFTKTLFPATLPISCHSLELNIVKFGNSTWRGRPWHPRVLVLRISQSQDCKPWIRPLLVVSENESTMPIDVFGPTSCCGGELVFEGESEPFLRSIGWPDLSATSAP